MVLFLAPTTWTNREKRGYMAKVFVVQDDGHKNLAPALEFGELRVLATRDVPMFGNVNPTIKAALSVLAPFLPEEDYLLCIGDPLLIGVAMHTILSNHKYVRCLKWDRQTSKYYPITIEI
jgi:hypothetical protein